VDNELQRLFSLGGQVAAITGGGGVLCGTLARALGRQGAKVAVLDIRPEPAQLVATDIRAAGGEAMAVACNVLDPANVREACQQILSNYGRVDILINGAGGNKPEATADPDHSFFDIPPEAVRWVFDLNFLGTLIPCQIFGRVMAEVGRGAILNISSMAAMRPLTRTVAYSASKAAISNFTQWLAVYISQNYPGHIRVNALAPGFFSTEQNQFLLHDEATGALTPRGSRILDHTPMGRFGEPEDLVPAALWLLSEAGSFVHGAVIPIDGGFSAYSGV
jgi:NAD(P)-dependent dehydrogenase (short-subunit alcohol dehydrogenase family)